MKTHELAQRHQHLVAKWAILREELKTGSLHPSIRKWRGLAAIREPHVVWSESQALLLEMEVLALHFYGAEIGGNVQLTGKRYGGALARIENVEIKRRGSGFTPLGEKPAIWVHSPKGRDAVRISGHLWELVLEDV